jgi:hypothetical protein
MPDDNLLFETDPSFPALWILGLIGFLALWWYGVRTPAQRRMVLVLWAPATLVGMLVYRYGHQGLSTAETLRLLAAGDQSAMRDLVGPVFNGPTLTYGFVVGGTAAVCVTMVWHLIGVVLGVAIAPLTGGGRHRSRPL